MSVDAALVHLLEQAILLVTDRSIEPAAQPAQPSVTLERFDTQPWASATFEGHRHEFDLLIAGPEDAVDGLGSAMIRGFLGEEFSLGGHVLADIQHLDSDKLVDGDGASALRISFEALTVRG